MDSPFCFLLYCLDSLPAFFQYLFQFLHGRGSQHGDSRLAEIGNALEDRGGNVEMDSITAKEICTELKNGSSVFSKTQSDRIKSEIENGSVVFEHPTSSQYDCTVKNGEIKGDVVGRYEDYTVKARVKNGSCMLKSRLDAANQHAMNLYVENGRIEVHFKN